MRKTQTDKRYLRLQLAIKYYISTITRDVHTKRNNNKGFNDCNVKNI